MAEDKIAPESKPAETPPEIPEERLRAYVREKYGVEDDPDTWKSKRQQEREALDTIPRYQEALKYLSERQAQAQAPPKPQEPDEATLRDQARLDPWAAISYVRKKDREEYLGQLAAVNQAVTLRDWEAQAERFNARLAEDWPEAHDKSSDLHKEGARIYQSMGSDEKARPDAPWRATAIAAGLLGLAPKARRGSSETPRGGVADEVAGQNASRGSRAPRGEGAPPALTERQAKIAKVFGVKGKDYAMARKELGEGTR